ncbi:MAG: DNA-3-methyladenine glycosylase [Myxococcaceae bacterium]|nr:DNA-3-methyladenine glycosylase [Myxococcaceae bacterium]
MAATASRRSRLPLPFYARPALEVAPDLLGKVLVHQSGRVRRAGRIVETEAYIGEHDLACHASKGRTKRTDVLFGPPGHAYVYLIYGMYDCFNVVVEPEGVAAAVLVRGLEPLEGIGPHHKTNGPGKLCRAMHITRAHNRMDLRGDHLFIEDAPPVPSELIATGPRIGVEYSGEWADKPFRFWIRDNPWVSKVPKRRARR